MSDLDPAHIADRFTPACPTCGHGFHRHLQTKPGCRDCPGHQGYNRPGQCAETRASATGKALLAVLEAVTPAIEANALREAVRLLEYALNLRMYGDGHGEKQSDWDQQCEAYLRSLPMELRYQRADQISPKEDR